MSTFAVVLVRTGGAANAADTVFSTDIVDGEVQNADLASNAVTSEKIYSNSVNASDVRDNNVTSSEIASDSVTSSELATNAVNFSEIATSAVDVSEIAAGAVGASELGSGAVPSRTYTRQANTAIDTTTSKEITVACDVPQDKVVGGGFVIAGAGGANVPNVAIQRSFALNASTWLVRAAASSGAPNWQITVVATCIS